jgi:hypothetical protein
VTWVAALVVLDLALGGIMYVMNLAAGRGVSGKIAGVGYGDWANAWMFPYLAFVRPFSDGDGAVWVPWTRSFWFWPMYDHYFSTWGWAYSVLLPLVPVGVWRFPKILPERARERTLATILVVIVFALMLPVRLQRPVGFFEGLVRYTMFLPPILALWTIVPATRAIADRARLAACGVIAACAVLFTFQAVACARKDAYIPLQYVAVLVDHPELARVPYDFNRRAAHVVDAMAGPEDAIAFDGGFSSFVYPAYGADLGRTVTYLHPDAGPGVAIADDVKWVVCDRAWNALFNNPAFTDFGKWRQYILKGTPTAEDMVVFDQVSRDPRFELVYRDAKTNQAVFRRR